MNQTLIQISDDLSTIYELLDECDGDVSDPKVAEAIDEFFAECSDNLTEKADNYAAMIREKELRSGARKEESKRLADRARIDERQAKFMKERLLYVMDLHGMKTLEGPRFRMTAAKAGGKLPLQIIDGEDITPEFTKYEAKPDNEAIRAALDEGRELPFAKYGERSTSLRIK